MIGDFAQEADPVCGVCGAHGGYETAEVRHVRRVGGGRAVCVGGQEKAWMGCFLEDLRAFGINADQRTTAAQDEGKWRRTAEQGAEHFMAKWIAAEKARAGLRHAVIQNIPEGDGKDQGEDSPKQEGSCWFARLC